MRTRGLIACAAVVIVALVTGGAPTRIPLEASVRRTLPSATVIHVVTYPTDPPPLITANAMAAGGLFGAIGGAVVGARAGHLWLGTCDLRGDDDTSKAPTLDELEAEDGIVYRRLLADQTAACATSILEQSRGTAPSSLGPPVEIGPARTS